MRFGAALFHADHGRLAEEVERLGAAGVDFVHLDVFDGHFVPDLGFPPRTIAALRSRSALPFEVHLGVRTPERFLPALAAAGVDRVLTHAEASPLLFDTLFAIREQGLSAGVALALGAPLALLWPVLGMIDAVLLIARTLGEGTGGSAFQPAVIARCRDVAARVQRDGARVDVQVAGGVRREHVRPLADSGATSLALGSGLYRREDMAAELLTLRQEAANGRR